MTVNAKMVKTENGLYGFEFRDVNDQTLIYKHYRCFSSNQALKDVNRHADDNGYKIIKKTLFKG